ncbi:MAG: YccF domain-containing protein [Oscillospiraceae bacterium]|nr:YccF domain-containing protein [Oscillospiraceae bacterium]
MKTIGNIIWILFGGFVVAIMWCVSGLVCCCTIVGIPLGIQCFKIASFVLWPFGKKINYINAGRFGSCIGNILWWLIFGWELALTSCLFGLLFCVTIIGIPFGLQFFKLAQLSFMPFGATFN